jgi:hypothetical protein
MREHEVEGSAAAVAHHRLDDLSERPRGTGLSAASRTSRIST